MRFPRFLGPPYVACVREVGVFGLLQWVARFGGLPLRSEHGLCRRRWGVSLARSSWVSVVREVVKRRLMPLGGIFKDALGGECS